MGKVYTRFLSCVADRKREGGGKKALSPQSLSLFPFLPIPSRRLLRRPTVFRPKRRKNPTRWGGTYLRDYHPPPPPFIISLRSLMSKVFAEGASCDSSEGRVWDTNSAFIPGGDGGGGGHSYKYGLYGDVPLYRVWVLTSLSETGYLIISLESMYFRVRILNLQRLTYTQEYVKRILNDELINKKKKQYLLHEDPKPGSFYILPKSQ